MNDELREHLNILYEVVRQNKDNLTFPEEKKTDLQNYLAENEYIGFNDYEKFFENLMEGGASLFNPIMKILYMITLQSCPKAIESYDYMYNLYWQMQEIKI